MFRRSVEKIAYHLTTLCLWAIPKLNRSKDRYLSQELFDLAENYNCHPGRLPPNYDQYKDQ